MPELNIYSKEQTDALLGNKANTSDVYTKANVDSLLSNKANTSDVYTKAQVDTALDDKQDILTAGTGITISNNVISASASGSANLIFKQVAQNLTSIADIDFNIPSSQHKHGFIMLRSQGDSIIANEQVYDLMCIAHGTSMFTPVAFGSSNKSINYVVLGGVIGGDTTTSQNKIVVMNTSNNNISIVQFPTSLFRLYTAINPDSSI